MTSLVLRKVIKLGTLKLRLVRVGPGVISQGVMKLERVQVICPACGEQVEAVASDGRVKGYCAAAKQYVDFLIEAQRVPIGKDRIAETRAKLSAAAKKPWQDPEFRARHSAGMKKRWQDPEYRARQIASHSATSKKFGQDPESRARRIATSKKPWQDPEYRARHSAATKKLWQDPEYQAKQIATHTSKHPTAKTKAKISAALKRRHQGLQEIEASNSG